MKDITVDALLEAIEACAQSTTDHGYPVRSCEIIVNTELFNRVVRIAEELKASITNRL
jgi:hypothetical protein